MGFSQDVTVSVTILVCLIFFGMGLREMGILKEEHGGVLANLITHVTLPALIFSALSSSSFKADHILLAVAMIAAELACGLLAWGVSILLRLSRPRKGALILASMFGSSAFLGYAVIKSVYEGNVTAMADAAIVSELGVGLILFTLGVFIAISFGSNSTKPKERNREIIKFFYSPIFISLCLGLLVSVVPIRHDYWLVKAVYKALAILAGANTFLVTMTIGVMLHFRDLRRVLPIVLLACGIKLVVQPVLANMEASMPTGAMTAVFARRYGCDAELTSILVFATFLSSIFTMIVIIVLLS